MKNIFAILALTLSSLVLLNAQELPPQIEIGARTPNTNQVLTDVSGVDLTLADLKKDNGLLVIFSCNTCPFVIAWEDRYPQIAEFCNKNDIGFVLVNSNEAKRFDADSYEAMKAHAVEKNYTFYYALDQNHQLADAFGATKTPDVFLFDSGMTLRYKGAIDDNHEDARQTSSNYLMDALKGLVTGRAIDPTVTKAIGCSIKRVY